MADQSNSECPKRERWQAQPETLAALKVSGNPINGLGKQRSAGPRRSSGIRLICIRMLSCRLLRERT